MKLDRFLLDTLSAKARASERLRTNFDLRNSSEDSSQRMLNALEPGTVVPVHRHVETSETVMVVRGRIKEFFYDEDGSLQEEFELSPDGDIPALNIPKGQWHTLESLETGTVILEMKNGRFNPESSYEVFGGKASQKSRGRISLCLAKMSDTNLERHYVNEAFDTNWVAPLGPNVNAFEDALKEYVGEGKEVVALSCGTAAVHLALLACGVGPGDEVCVQSFTFCASSNPVKYLGAVPVFIDSEEDSWNMDPELLEKAIQDRIAVTGRKPKAIVPVALYGMPYDVDRIMSVAEKYDIPVVEDSAEGFGSTWKGRRLGTFGRFGVLSFNGNKMITTSGGGALVCPDKETKNHILWLATQAREAYPYYQHEAIGFNYRMSNICAGIGRGQMTVVDEHVSHHRHMAELYASLLEDIPGVTLHKEPSGAYGSNFWLNTVTVDPSVKVAGQENAYRQQVTTAVGGAAGVVHQSGSTRTDFEPNPNVEALRICMDKAGIESRPLWKPMHLQPVYRDCPSYMHRRDCFGGKDLPVCASLFKVGLCLPSGPWVTDEDARFVAGTIKSSIL